MKFLYLKNLSLVFIALKLSNHIAWDWAWVLSPFIAAGVFTVIDQLIEASDK